MEYESLHHQTDHKAAWAPEVHSSQDLGHPHHEELRSQVVLEVLSGAKTPVEACGQYHIPPGILALWKAHFLARAARHLEAETLIASDQGRISELVVMTGWILHYGKLPLVFTE